jgi:hypothetical protein
MSDEYRSNWIGWRPSVWSGWRDLNSRPLDPQIGPCRSLSVSDLSLMSVVDRGNATSLLGLVRSWSVVPTPFHQAAQTSFAIPVSLRRSHYSSARANMIVMLASMLPLRNAGAPLRISCEDRAQGHESVYRFSAWRCEVVRISAPRVDTVDCGIRIGRSRRPLMRVAVAAIGLLIIHRGRLRRLGRVPDGASDLRADGCREH